MQTNRNQIIYLGNFSFPELNAAGKRVYNNAKVLRELGYEVTIIGTELDQNKHSENIHETYEVYDGFISYSFPYPQSTLEWLEYRKYFSYFLNIFNTINIEEVHSIIIYNTPTISFFSNKILKFSKKNSIKTFSDCTDWLTSKTSNPLFNLFKNTDTWFQKAYFNKKFDGLIAISDYLRNYYDKHTKTVVVPPLNDIPNELHMVESDNHNSAHVVKLIYAGIPFRLGIKLVDRSTSKDRLDRILELLYIQKKRNTKFVFNIIGLTTEQYLTAIPEHSTMIKEMEDCVIFHGNIDQSLVEDSIINSDYSILIRDIKRDTLAGFSTKISESVSLGVPVIVNRVGDLEKYIVDGENGFFLDLDSKTLNEDLSNILNADEKQILELKRTTLSSSPFSWKKYINEFKVLLEE